MGRGDFVREFDEASVVRLDRDEASVGAQHASNLLNRNLRIVEPEQGELAEDKVEAA